MFPAPNTLQWWLYGLKYPNRILITMFLSKCFYSWIITSFHMVNQSCQADLYMQRDKDIGPITNCSFQKIKFSRLTVTCTYSESSHGWPCSAVHIVYHQHCQWSKETNTLFQALYRKTKQTGGCCAYGDGWMVIYCTAEWVGECG